MNCKKIMDILKNINLKNFKIIYLITFLLIDFIFILGIFNFLKNSFFYFVHEKHFLNYLEINEIIKHNKEIIKDFWFWVNNHLLNIVVFIIVLKIIKKILQKIPAIKFILNFEKENELSSVLCRKIANELRYSNSINIKRFMELYYYSEKELNYLMNVKNNKELELFVKKYDSNAEKDLKYGN